MNFIACDPGVSGGFAWQIHDEIGCARMPDHDVEWAAMVRSLLARGGIDQTTFVIERLPKFTGAKIPGSVMAVLHDNCGVVRGAALALCAKVVVVDPQEWQAFFRLGTKGKSGSKTAWKNKLKAEAIRRFPSRNITLATADALLILEWARLTGR